MRKFYFWRMTYRPWKNVFLLCVSYALFMTGVSAIISSSALIGKSLAEDSSLATLPISVQYLFTLLLLLPISFLIRWLGYNRMFVVGALLGAVGMGISALSIVIKSFLLFVLCKAFVGIHNAVAQYYRFAAAESVPSSEKAKAISLTLVGGLGAAFLGPAMVAWSKNLTKDEFTATFLILTGTNLLSATLLSFVNIPQFTPQKENVLQRKLRDIIKQPTFIMALACSTIGYVVMNFLMIAAPLAMDIKGCSFSTSASVIQWHLVSMFAPSFFTGHLIQKIGLTRIVGAGSIILIGAVGINLFFSSMTAFTLSMILLGIGWNFLFVSGSSLLTKSYLPSEREKVQGTHDTILFSAIVLSSLFSGIIHYNYGWQTLNLLVLPFPFLIILGVFLYKNSDKISF